MPASETDIQQVVTMIEGQNWGGDTLTEQDRNLIAMAVQAAYGRTEPTVEEILAAQDYVAEFRQYINKTPALVSLLYDLDLMPEQVMRPINAVRMGIVCRLYAMLSPDQADTFFAGIAEDADDER